MPITVIRQDSRASGVVDSEQIEYGGLDTKSNFYRKQVRGPGLRLGYPWAILGVAIATGVFWLGHAFVENGQASLLYLPVVLSCAWYSGFGPAVLAAVLSFFCWNFFFLPPLYTFVVADPRDWLSLFVFLLAAVITARLASQARAQADAAHSRELEIATLHQASVAISQEVSAERLLPALTEQLRQHCGTERCIILRQVRADLPLEMVASDATDLSAEKQAEILARAQVTRASDEVIGLASGAQMSKTGVTDQSLVSSRDHDLESGVYVPLHADARLVGILHLGPRRDLQPFSPQEQRLILTLANHAAVVIARQQLVEEAAQTAVLKEADQLKESLMSLVSHELRTPLAAIKAVASGLLQPDSRWDERTRQDAIVTINSEADRLTTVVSNLLDLSRLEAGAWHPQKDWCEMTEIVGTVLDRLPTDAATRIQVSCPTSLLLQADHTQVALVLTNLLENALKYSPAPLPIELEVKGRGVRERRGPNDDRGRTKGDERETTDEVAIRVRDFGQGLVPGEEGVIFERFSRGSRHDGSSIHGTGLGLALCKAIILAHGGRIWASNAPAGEAPGAIFAMVLPTGEGTIRNLCRSILQVL